MKKKAPNFIVEIEEKQATEEEQIKAIFQLFTLMLDGNKKLLESNEISLTDEEKKQIEDFLVLLPIFRELAAPNGKDDIF